MNIQKYVSGKALDYDNSAKAKWRKRVYNRVFKGISKEGKKVALFDAQNGKESELLLKAGNVRITNVEREEVVLSAWKALEHVKLNNDNISYYKGDFTGFLNKEIKALNSTTDYENFHCLTYDRIGYYCPAVIKDLTLVNKNKLSKYLVLNIQNNPGGIRGSSIELKAMREKCKHIKDFEGWHIKKLMNNYDIIESFVYTSSVKPMRTFIFKLKKGL